jgi:hypothetical protein
MRTCPPEDGVALFAVWKDFHRKSSGQTVGIEQHNNIMNHFRSSFFKERRAFFFIQELI